MRGMSRPLQWVEHQASAYLNQANPTQNLWYEVLDKKNVRVIYMVLRVDTTQEDIEMRLTVDGQVITGAAAGVANTDYFGALYGDSSGEYILWHTNFYDGELAVLEGKEVKVEVRKTSNNGAGNLRCRVGHGLRAIG